MGTFRHHPDDFIYIDDLELPLAFFQLQEPLYTLPGPYISRDYVQSPASHILKDGENQFDGGLPYSDGDTYISNKATYAAAYDLFLNPLPSLPEAKIIKLDELRDFSDAKKEEKVIYSANTYKSDKGSFVRINWEFEKFTRDAAVPGGYYVKNDSDTQVSFNLSQLGDLVDLMIDFYYEVDQNFDTHEANINALGTVGAVEAYDFSSGWPATPYT